MDAFLLGVVDFLFAGGHFRLAAPVDDRHIRPQTARTAGCVHRDVAAANDCHALTDLHGRIMLREGVGAHEVDAGQELIGGIDAAEAFAGNLLEVRQTRARSDEDRVIALFEQFFHRHGTADNRIRDDFHAQLADIVDFLLHKRFRQTELRDAVHQHAAGGMERFVDGHVPARARQIRRTGQTSRARTDDCRFLARRRCCFRGHRALGHGIVRRKAFQTADADRFALDTADALAFALRFLRADAAANRREAVLQANRLVCFLELALLNMRDEVRNRHIHRAALDAGRILAMQAAVSFLHGDFAGIAQRDFLEIRRADVRLLLRHRMLLKTHVRHYRTPPVRRHLWSFSIARCSSGRNMRLREIASAQST